ncbi:MAG: O-antigen ligase family protein [Desulfobacterales bacterium]|nr:O-antigen ligase family protein [Desulfobacterales bacterium]
MGKAILLCVIALTVLQTVKRPFVGALAYYCLAIWGPQYIWWWNFEGMRLSLIVAAVTMGAFMLYLFRTGVNFGFLKSRLNFFVIVLWLAYCISYSFGPYVGVMGEEPYEYFVKFSKIILFYVIAVLILDDVDKQKYFSYVIILSMFHLTWWANYQYISQNWSAFYMGRLKGPIGAYSSGIYGDENTFAMFFVSAIPFLYYWGLYLGRGMMRYVSWAVIPLGWHAVFLTGSRGGLVGLAATLFAGVIFSKNRKTFMAVLIPVFLVVFAIQGGEVLKSRSSTIVDYEGETSAETRLQAWSAAVGMLNEYPFTGVGVACFIKAMPDFSDKQPRATHSVPFQFAGEIGAFALIAYCLIVMLVLLQGLRNNRLIDTWAQAFDPAQLKVIRYLNEASVVSVFGLAVCSLFLSWNYYEIFYYLLIIAGFLNYYITARIKQYYAENRTA